VTYLYRFLRSLLRIVWRIAKKGAEAREIIARSNVTRNASNETPRSAHICQLILITHPWRGTIAGQVSGAVVMTIAGHMDGATVSGKPDLVEVRKAASLGGLFHFQRADGVIE
jgi:hypothetical protein